MPNAVAGNLPFRLMLQVCIVRMPGRSVCTLGREEVNREALVQKNRTLLAKSIQSSRYRSVVNLLFNYVEEVSTARKDARESRNRSP